MSNSFVQQYQKRKSEAPVIYRNNGPCSRLCFRDHNYSNPSETAWLNNNNDPLQDFIRRSYARQACNSNKSCHGRLVYSTLSTERKNLVIRRTSTLKYMSSSQFNETARRGRPYFIRPSINCRTFKNHTENKEYCPENIQSSQNRIGNNLERLAFIEQYIKRNTNQFGYVTLNETILKELGTAIFECLSRRMTVTYAGSERKFESLYEPISPAGNSDDDEN